VSKQLIKEVAPYINLYLDSKTGIALVENGTGRMIILKGPDEKCYHVPFKAIAHITIAGQEIG
jgi:hypothetical protein